MLARIVDVKRVEKPNDKRARPLIFVVDSFWHKGMTLLSLVKMKSFSQNLSISREPNALERETERIAEETPRTATEELPKEDLRMRNFKLGKKEDVQWIEA